MQRQLMALLHKRIEVGVAIVALVLVIGFTASTRGVWLSSANLSEVLRVTAVQHSASSELPIWRSPCRSAFHWRF